MSEQQCPSAPMLSTRKMLSASNRCFIVICERFEFYYFHLVCMEYMALRIML